MKPTVLWTRNSIRGFVRPSVRLSVRPSVMVIELKSVKTRISAPAHPSATGIGRVSGLVFSYLSVSVIVVLQDSWKIRRLRRGLSTPAAASEKCHFLPLHLCISKSIYHHRLLFISVSCSVFISASPYHCPLFFAQS